jgi:RNA polymerase sigma-70 factor (ECF subfamily)
MPLRAAADPVMSDPMTLTMPFRSARYESAERSLVDRLRAGDVAALAEAYDAHYEHVHAFARRLLGDDAAAEDLVQETFISLRAAIRNFTERSSLRTFLVSIAVNRARHHVRAAARRRAATARFGALPRTSTPTPEDHLEQVQLATALSRALDTLPLDQRVAFVLVEVEERTSAEAAAIVDANETTVRARVWHARRKIRALLKEESR